MERRSFLQQIAIAPVIAATWTRGMPPAFEAEIQRLMEVGPVPGAVTGTLQHGEPGWIKPLGVRSAESKEPVTRDSIFQAASLSKQVAAYAAFALRAGAKLDFDRPLSAYVDDLASEQARTVTARHVLSHSSGFPNWRNEAGQQLVPDFAPGSRFEYSGEGYFYLQRVMEHVTGKGYGALIDELVFQPLGMTSSSMLWRPDWQDRYALPHDRRGAPRKNWDSAAKRVYDFAKRHELHVNRLKYAEYSTARGDKDPELPNWMLPNAAASMVTSGPDYARFLAAAIKNPDIRKEQVKIRPSLGWGLGWGIERVEGKQYLWQWGDNGGYKNFVAIDSQSGDGVFVFTNGDSGMRVCDRIVTNCTGHDHPALFWI